MKINVSDNHANSNSRLVLYAFIITVFFQITMYRFIWGIELISRVLNIFTIVIFSSYSVHIFNKNRFNKNVLIYYIWPGFFVFIGLFINTTICSISNLSLINQYGRLIPWAMYLSIPNLLTSKKINVSELWRYFNNFMFVSVLISITEYYLLLLGVIVPREIITPGGSFLAGFFSMLWADERGEIYYRFYSSFAEPGTLAMFLLPVMAYSFLHKKYFYLAVYLVAMFLTESLGGFIGCAMLIPLLVYFKYKKNWIYNVTMSLFSVLLLIILLGNEFNERYQVKNYSALEREENAIGVVTSLPSLFFKYPLGLPLVENTALAMQNPDYHGATFTPGNIFNNGGVLSFIGYISVLFVSLRYAISSLFRKVHSLDEQVAIVSIFCLIPFIYQRMVVWDTSVFALLFAPFVINYLHRVSTTASIGGVSSP